jgi:hypothetical protein
MQITYNTGKPIVAKEGLGEFNFGDFFDKVTSTAADIYKAKVDADAQKAASKLALEQARAQYQNVSPDYLFPSGGGYSPVYGAPNAGINLMPILLIGGVGLAAFLLLRK